MVNILLLVHLMELLKYGILQREKFVKIWNTKLKNNSWLWMVLF
jgi:hypothetical protein